MSVQACAEIVARGDPDRFLAAMSCPPSARAALFPLYALNVEIARAPYVTQEPAIAEMRLQWWRDALDEIAAGAPARAHEVAGPLTDLLRRTGVEVALLDAAVAARRWDIWHAPFETDADFARHLDRTAGNLAWASARALGAPPADEAAVRDGAWAAGLVRWFQAVPEMEARGMKPLPDGRPEAVRALAHQGLDRLASARRAVRRGPAALALRPAWEAGALLRQVADAPGRVADGAVHLSEFRRRLLLSAAAVRGGW